MALLIALALFVAQVVNFALLLNERKRIRIEQATRPAVTRLVDAADGNSAEGPLFGRNGGIDLLPASPIRNDREHRADVEAALRDALADTGVKFGRIETEVRPIAANDPRMKRWRQRGLQRWLRATDEIVIAVQQPGRGWLVLRAPWRRGDLGFVWGLVAQTLILYGIILLPVLWIGRRLSRPLRDLAAAARDFTPGRHDAIEERGPQDVRDVIAAFNALRLRVTGMLDEKDRMLGAIGHDLRTPLAALRVRIESVEDDDDRARMADTIDEMNRTLDDILSLARVGKPSEPITDVDVAALVDAVVEDFRDLDQPVQFDEPVRLRMKLRPTLMRRAVRNLIENALKYGGAAEVRLREDERQVVIEVADRGPGIPADRLADVFDPFTRLEASRNKDTGGIGLGLALTRAITRDAGGEVVLASRPEGGLRATIVLPR
ncbi:sensor histidine kinase [Sphingomonas aracearum]|uniref:histidine kinase n=2 Tax=Sphingomonas aracearum TaxID=2283317 RepID=A0A369W0Q2_9SPHN|nr:sensor histidine kinase [Sphingomonas aracearum]